MIAALQTPEQKKLFSDCVRGKPYFGALLGRDLALWADNPGAPVKLFWADGAALAVSGRGAQLCGVPQNYEETDAFLRFAGAERVTCSVPPPCWTLHRMLYLYTLEAGCRLPAGIMPTGLLWRDDPSVMEIAGHLFEGEPERIEAFYSETCTAVAHGYAQVAALYDADGRQVSTVGAYAMCGGEAYMAMGETVENLRGQGIGGWLIVSFANRLSGQGWRVSFLCEEKRRHFYDSLGFACTEKYGQYLLK